jgi:hypothetical protein
VIEQHEKMIDRAHGTLYRSEDGTEAQLKTVSYAKRCAGTCGEVIAAGDDALAVGPGEAKNTTGEWMLFCLSCAQETVFEPIVGAPWRGRKRTATVGTEQ